MAKKLFRKKDELSWASVIAIILLCLLVIGGIWAIANDKIHIGINSCKVISDKLPSDFICDNESDCNWKCDSLTLESQGSFSEAGDYFCLCRGVN